MSDAISVMNGATADGAVHLADAGLCGMITLRGDLGDAGLAAAVKSVIGLSIPKPRQIKQGRKGGVAWMSPDELLLFVRYEVADASVAKLTATLGDAHHLAANVSDARAMFTLTGAGVRQVIAKGAPVDMSETGLPVGELRRSRIGQIAAAFWLSDAETLHVVCFRSVGQHMFSWLKMAAETGTLPEIL